MSSLLRGEFSESVESFTVIDCRFPYEFAGGHIQVENILVMVIMLSDEIRYSVSCLQWA